MLFKLALRNIRSSIRDYAIYFFTLVIGVSIFYSFNAINGQTAMLELVGERGRIAGLLSQALSMVSVLVAFVLGLLIVYASRFLMKRRSQEFAIYLLLGMGRRRVSAILVMETLITGIVSLAAGLVIGTCISQLMGLLVINLFSADMSAYQFSFSSQAFISTVIYFVIMYAVTILFSGWSIGRMKLIDLIQSERKTETVRLRNPFLCMAVLLLAVIMLAFAYFNVAWNTKQLSGGFLALNTGIGFIATFFLFWSVSGLAMRFAGASSNVMYRGLNRFTFREISGKINTVVTSMTVICLMLFFTICALASAFSMRNGMNRNLGSVPADYELRHQEILFDREKGPVFDDIVERYAAYEYDLTEAFGSYVHFHSYYDPEFHFVRSAEYDGIWSANDYPDIIKLSDYNQLMNLYGKDSVELSEDHYLLMCTYSDNTAIFQKMLRQDPEFTIFGHTLLPQKSDVLDGYIDISANHSNIGLIIIPDQVADESHKAFDFFIADFREDYEGPVEDLEAKCRNEHDMVIDRMWEDEDKGLLTTAYYLRLYTRIEIIDSMIGAGALLTILGLYLGVIFLIASGAVLALRTLSDSVDSVPRYDILRKIGADEKDIRHSLLVQTLIFFGMPLSVAVIHSIFGLKMAKTFISMVGTEGMGGSIAFTAFVIALIYGGYFAISYAASLRVINPERDYRERFVSGRALRRVGIAGLVAILSLSAVCAVTLGRKAGLNNGIPWIDVDLEGVVTSRTSAEAKDNFALYANKDAILDLTIPEGYSTAGTMTNISIQSSEELRALFQGERPATHDARLAYDLYGLLTDWDSRNALGIEPLKNLTDEVEAVSSLEELSAYLVGHSHADRLSSLWTSGVTTDLEDSTKRVLFVGTGGLTLHDSAEYSRRTEYGTTVQKAYTQLMRKMLMKLGYSEEEAEAKIERNFAFEEMIATAIPTSAERGRSNYRSHCNNHYTRSELQEAEGKLPILEQMDHEGYPERDDYIVQWPAYLDRLNEVYTEENLQMMKDYIILAGVSGYAAQLDWECYEWNEDFINTISGVSESPDFDTSAAEIVGGMVRWPVARLYSEAYLNEGDKARVTALVEEIVDEYHSMLKEADFLSEETKAKAIEKLEAITYHILYPDNWEPYSCEELNFAGKEEGGTYWDAQHSIARYETQKEVELCEEPVDRTEWNNVPQDANCFYEPQTNSIYIMGAFVHSTLYNHEMSTEELYARLGTVIGHELSHAFDSKGSQYDKDGNLLEWWTDEERDAFRKKNERLANYFNSIHPWEGLYLRGNILTGEACADMAGFKAIMRLAARKPEFDYDSFFRNYADVWLTKDNLAMAKSRVDDAHPMPYLRINVTLQQFDEFYKTYNVQEGDGMYLSEENRVLIW